MAPTDPRQDLVSQRLPDGPVLVDRDRARHVMGLAGLDALVLTRTANVVYTTGLHPAADRMGALGQGLVVVPREPRIPMTLILPVFSYYYGPADRDLPEQVTLSLYHSGYGPFRIAGEALSPRERRRQDRIAASPSPSPDRVEALTKALRGLGDRFGVDQDQSLTLAGAAAPGAHLVPCEDVVRHWRKVKTAQEIGLVRRASAATLRAMTMAANQVRQQATRDDLRRQFAAEMALQGGAMAFMVIDGLIDDGQHEGWREGDAVLIDAVGRLDHYHGDIARTLFVGEPNRVMARVVQHLDLAWTQVREALRPGLAFTAIRTLGQAALRGAGADLSVPFNPHLVGLHHSDMPALSLDGRNEDIVLEAGMVLSVDCPLMDAGLGGSAHLEDLMLITPDGAEPLHDRPPAALIL